MLLHVAKNYYMLNVVTRGSVVEFCASALLLHVGQCCYTWHCVVERGILCAAVLYVVMCSCMLCSAVTCYQGYYMLCSVVRCAKSYYMLLHVVNLVVVMCSWVITCCAVLLHVTKSYICVTYPVLLNFIIEVLYAVQCCYMLQELLHAVQCCYMLPRALHVVQCCYVLSRVIPWCAVLLHVAKNYYMLGNVVTRGIVLLNFVHVMLLVLHMCSVVRCSWVITCCAVLLHVIMLCSVVTCYQELLHAVCSYMLQYLLGVTLLHVAQCCYM